MYWHDVVFCVCVCWRRWSSVRAGQCQHENAKTKEIHKVTIYNILLRELLFFFYSFHWRYRKKVHLPLKNIKIKKEEIKYKFRPALIYLPTTCNKLISMPIVVRCTAKHTFTRLYTSDVYIPDSGCSLGGRLKDSQKVRVSALAADAAALRKPLCLFGEKGICIYISYCQVMGGSTQRKIFPHANFQQNRWQERQ